MKALERARSLLEAAELDLTNGTPNLERAAARRNVASGWLELARVQHAAGIPDAVAAPETPQYPKKTGR